MNNSMCYGTPARMLPDGYERCAACYALTPEHRLVFVDGKLVCKNCSLNAALVDEWPTESESDLERARR